MKSPSLSSDISQGKEGYRFDVPGAFEIPVAVATVARRFERRPDAVICLGLIWQGETTHAQHIGEAVTGALMRLAVETGVPVIHEVLTTATAEQARARCLTPETNRGTEADRVFDLVKYFLDQGYSVLLADRFGRLFQVLRNVHRRQVPCTGRCETVANPRSYRWLP